MFLMPRYRWLRRRSLCAALLALALSSACSRRVTINGGAGTSQSDSRDLPFHSDSDPSSTTDATSHPGVPDRDTSGKTVPFRPPASAVLPAGTLLSVRLENTLTSAQPLAGKTFQAVVEEPVIVNRVTVIPRDAKVAGSVESARLSYAKRRRTGYLRLTLDSIRVGDKEIPLPTSSLFARGIITSASEDSGAVGDAPVSPHRIVRLNKGRPLTFRLTATVDLGKPTADEKAQAGTK
jgi:hypothetical protein